MIFAAIEKFPQWPSTDNLQKKLKITIYIQFSVNTLKPHDHTTIIHFNYTRVRGSLKLSVRE